MVTLKEIRDSFLHLLFPHSCAGCGTDLISEESFLCAHCLADLPETGFHKRPGNPVEKIFRGRLPLESAMAGFYFKKDSLMQELIHQFKYKGHQDLGLQFGRMLGKYLAQSERFNADALVPLPLFPGKERRRGYNQAAVLCEGMAGLLKIPVLKNAVIRRKPTGTQTKKGRVERWNNMEGSFELRDQQAISNKWLLLVDDVVTTGATLEACGMELLKGENVTLSVASLCMAVNI